MQAITHSALLCVLEEGADCASLGPRGSGVPAQERVRGGAPAQRLPGQSGGNFLAFHYSFFFPQTAMRKCPVIVCLVFISSSRSSFLTSQMMTLVVLNL